MTGRFAPIGDGSRTASRLARGAIALAFDASIAAFVVLIYTLADVIAH
jgi:hypothetical protein